MSRNAALRLVGHLRWNRLHHGRVRSLRSSRRSWSRRSRCVHHARGNDWCLGDHLHRRTCNRRCWSRTCNLLLLLDRQRAAGGAGQCTLPLLERRRGRGRRGLGDHRPAHDGCRGTGSAGDRRRRTAKHARDLRAHWGRGCGGGHRSQLGRRHTHCDLLYGTRAGESVLRNGDHRSWNRTVGVIGRGNGAVLNVVVIHIRHVGVVDNRRICDVHARNVFPARVVRRDVDIARPKRKPTYRRSSAESNGNIHSPSASKAHPCHERRGINRSQGDRTRYPAPGITEMSPAAVVIRRESPGLIVNPTPSPRIDPCPMTVVIGRPIGRHVAGHPALTILRDVTPRSIFIEILVSHHGLRDIAG